MLKKLLLPGASRMWATLPAEASGRMVVTRAKWSCWDMVPPRRN